LANDKEAMRPFDTLRPLMRVSLIIIRRSKAVNGIFVFALTEAFAAINWEAGTNELVVIDTDLDKEAVEVDEANEPQNLTSRCF